MSQQEDMVTQDAGHEEETGSYVAVSAAADEAGGAEDMQARSSETSKPTRSRRR